jgi:phage FluMu gp28-like protein
VNLSERALFLIDNLDLPAASGVEGARWEHFQLAHLSDDSTFRIETKSRQIAWSFTVSAEAVARAVLNGEGTEFVSINLDESAEKIRYGRLVYENLRIGGLPKLIREHILGLEFDNGARIISHPSRPPRGRARMNVVLDEFAHVQRDREIYTAAMPVISKGGVLRIGSSPLGAMGVFWEIAAQELRPYPGFARKRTPWWELFAFSLNPKEARRTAPAMQTSERVELFGNERIKAIYANMPEEDFQQEYEAIFVDETTAWIPWELIKRNQQAFEDAGAVSWKASNVDQALSLVPKILEAIDKGKVEPALYGGIDVGRTRNLSELTALGRTTTGQLPFRLAVSLDNVEFDDQQRCFKELILQLPFVSVLVDKNGLGMQLAENLERTGRAQGVDFTNATKQLWAVEAKVQAERTNVPIPPDRDLAYQIHSIKKTVTAAKNNVFDTARNEKHHADKFWSWALAIWAAGSPTVITVENPFYD